MVLQISFITTTVLILKYSSLPKKNRHVLDQFFFVWVDGEMNHVVYWSLRDNISSKCLQQDAYEHMPHCIFL